MESASDDLIKHMCKQSGVIIKDINYDEVEKLEWRLSAEKDWSKLFCDKLDQRMKEGKAMCFGYTNLVGDAKKICQKFKDVLPIETIGEEDLLLGMDDVKIVYNGPRHPESRMEQLAFDLVSLVNKSADLEPMLRHMEKMGQGSPSARYIAVSEVMEEIILGFCAAMTID
ncbi:hypothetical protein GQ55_6G093100 [Panicum hallii var. hallii]|uniref:Uncharacterized protein n=1 Tax=Panicum hallii var. hallii TaxID=1504633 RepID=A0A2T7D5G9_9POAL|nr:hypothetical protein GQ55_6G093100 [Panicum hallii var. hallii]